MSGRETRIPPLNQSPHTLAAAAAMAEQGSQAVCAASMPRLPSPASAALAALRAQGRPPGCAQRLTVSIFFDGTGNNLDADEPTDEHSNVARLYRAHPIDDDVSQTYRRYVPGIGTYFREIGDPGGLPHGLAAGAYGQARLDWAFNELAQLLQKAEARAGNPSNPILEVRLAVFGFSRGAALARAFCRELQQRCQEAGSGHVLRAGALPGSRIVLRGGYPIAVYFLGLFDTVASVGTPVAFNNFARDRRPGLDWRDLFRRRGDSPQADLERLAFGEPGADPAPGAADGHAGWADGLHIPPLVQRCVHMVAAHEMRNSFPLDSTLRGSAYPPGVQEMVYPGVHSDVGGGYRAGEGGKSAMLAQVPLRAMLQAAIEAGVPIYTMENFPSSEQKLDFALDSQGAQAYAELMPLWREYMRPFAGARSLGEQVLAHMGVYWRYRLSAALQRAQAVPTPQQQAIERHEHAFAEDRKHLKQQYDQARREYARVAQEHARAEQLLWAAQSNPVMHAQVPWLREQAARLEQQRAVAQDKLRRLQARLETTPDDSGLLARLTLLDAWLLDDAKTLHRWRHEQPRRRMRAHYQALAEAYEEVVVQGRRLPADAPVFRFFETYVHDSLAAFDKDNTRPSDPRVLYVGGNVKKRYAAVSSQESLA